MGKLFLIATLWALSWHAWAGLHVFTCEPEWRSLVEELGGERVQAESATTAFQDPHHIEARPSLIAKMRRADLVVCTGAELETAWLPVLLHSAGNSRVMPGQPGYFEAAEFVTLRGIPTRVDRAAGDVHPAGNPHLHADPGNIARVAVALSVRLRDIDPAGATLYAARYEDFNRRWQAAQARWRQQATLLKGLPFIFHHENWVYLIAWLGLNPVGVLEPKPGVPPSLAHLSSLLEQLKDQPARAVVHAAHEDKQAATWLAKRAGIPVVVLPYTVGGSKDAQDLFSLFDVTLERLRAVAP